MTKDETLLVFTLAVSSVSVFLFGILLFMVLISATRDFRERTKSKLVKIMIWASIVVITFAIAVRIYPIFIFLLKERIKPLVEALYDKLPWIWEVSLSRYWERKDDFFHSLNPSSGLTGLEPAASALTGRCSNQLNYNPCGVYGIPILK